MGEEEIKEEGSLRDIPVPDDIVEEDRKEYRRILAIIQGRVPPEQPLRIRSMTRDDLLNQPDPQDDQETDARDDEPEPDAPGMVQDTPAHGQEPPHSPEPGPSPGPIKTRSGRKLKRNPAVKKRNPRGGRR